MRRNMSEIFATPSTDVEEKQDAARADINITAHGDRRSIEALYLELRELAKRNGLQIEYRVTQKRSVDQAGS